MSLPNPKDVRDLFEDLLNRPVTVNIADPLKDADVKRTMVNLYVDDALKLAAVIGLELPLAAYTGAALGLIPAGGAQDCVEGGTLTAMIAENVTEAANIMASLLNGPGKRHVRMYQRFLPGEAPPPDATGYLLALGRRLDLDIEVTGYGSGRLSVALAN